MEKTLNLSAFETLDREQMMEVDDGYTFQCKEVTTKANRAGICAAIGVGCGAFGLVASGGTAAVLFAAGTLATYVGVA